MIIKGDSKNLLKSIILCSMTMFILGCQQRTYNLFESPKLAAVKIKRSDFFSKKQLWYARVSGWDKSKIQSWEIQDKTKVNGARFELFRLSQDHAEKTWCPTPSELGENEKIFTTTEFNISLRGDKSRGTPKGSYLINFEKANERFLELNRLHFVAMFNDLSQMREALSQLLFSFLDVPAPRNSYLRFCLDDVYRGLYLNVEEIDQKFSAEVLGKSRISSIYEGRDGEEPDSGQLLPRVGSKSSADKFDGKGYKKIADSVAANFQDFELLVERIDANIKSAENQPQTETLSEIFDINSFIRWMAVNQLIGGWDNYYYNAKNYFLVNSGTVEKPFFHWVTLDLDNTFGVSFTQHDWTQTNIFEWESVRGGTHRLPLIRLVLNQPEWRKKYIAILNDLVSPSNTLGDVRGLLFKEISAYWKLIESSVIKESNTNSIDFTQTDPFKMAHTARQFTTSDIRAQVTEDSETAQDPFGWANMRSPHLRTYIKRKWKNVAEQLSRVQ